MKLLFTLISGFITFNSFGQCDPLANNWGTSVWGFAPFTVTGAVIEDGYMGQPYNDEVYVWMPNTIVALGSPTDWPLDSLVLDSVTANINGVDVSISNLGLSYSCNNNGSSVNSCTFPSTIKCCGNIFGTPTMTGTFDLRAYGTLWGTNFGITLSNPYISPSRTITILNSTSVTEVSSERIQLSNSPNPAGDFTEINFQLENPSKVNISIYNVLGELVSKSQINASKGPNKYRLDTTDIPNGIYIYSLEAGKVLSGKMNVQH